MNSKISDITKNHLHISHSQVWAYLNCSLRYWFQYVKGLPSERTSIALIFGGAIHKALERYYLDIMRANGPTDLVILKEIFTDNIMQGTDNTDIPILNIRRKKMINERAMLVTLNISQWTGRKKDKKVTKETNAFYGAADASG